MTARRHRRRTGRHVLSTLAVLLLASGGLRFADGAGPALARGLAAAESGRAQAEAGSPASCDVDGEARATLHLLRDRAEELDQQEKQLAHKAQTLRLAEEEIRHNLAALKEAEESLKATLALAEGAAESDIERLTNVYQSMKPKEAAALFEEMDPTFAAGFLAQMRPESAAAVLAGMSSKKAYLASLILAGRHAAVPTK